MDNDNKFVEVLESDAFREDLKAANTREEVQATFAEYGVDLDQKEVDAFLKIGLEESQDDEISTSELELVTGGSGVDFWTIIKTSYDIIKDVAKHAWNAGKKFAQWESGLRSR